MRDACEVDDEFVTAKHSLKVASALKVTEDVPRYAKACECCFRYRMAGVRRHVVAVSDKRSDDESNRVAPSLDDALKARVRAQMDAFRES